MVSDVLLKRLNECGMKVEDLIENVSVQDDVVIIVYTSHMDGLGNKNSDYDIYVLVNKLPDSKKLSEFNSCKSRIEKVKAGVVDVEYWEYKEVDRLINLEDFNKDITKMKILERLLVGDIVKGEERGNEIKRAIEGINIKNKIAEYFQGMASQEYDDAVKMFTGNNMFCALNCARRALDYIMGAYNARNGVAVLNVKWIPQILSLNEGFGNKDILDKYLYYQIYSVITEETLTDFVEELINYVSLQMFEVTCL